MTARRYTAIEVVGALVIFGLFLQALTMAIVDLRRARDRFTCEQRALTALDNTVEQLAARKRTTPDRARALLAHELAAAGLAPGLTAVATPGKDDCELAIRDQDGRTVAHLRLAFE